MKLVAAPNWGRHERQQIEDALDNVGLVSDPHWARDRVTEVGDHPVTPASNFVAKDPEASEETTSDRSLADDAALLPSDIVNDGRHLDEVPTTARVGDERRVVEVAARTPLDQGSESLVDHPARADHSLTGTERDPVQVQARNLGSQVLLNLGTPCRRHGVLLPGAFVDRWLNGSRAWDASVLSFNTLSFSEQFR